MNSLLLRLQTRRAIMPHPRMKFQRSSVSDFQRFIEAPLPRPSRFAGTASLLFALCAVAAFSFYCGVRFNPPPRHRPAPLPSILEESVPPQFEQPTLTVYG
jgi:hypothetical protein